MVKFGINIFLKTKKSFNPIQVLVITKAPSMLDFTSFTGAFLFILLQKSGYIGIFHSCQ
jgi:hypothetical protein